MRVPPFPLDDALEEWDDFRLVTACVYLEAESEPGVGKLAVSWCIRNRMDTRRLPAWQVVLQPLQFSCFNHRPAAYERLKRAQEHLLEDCYWATAGGLWKMVEDPTLGADHYLQIEMTRQQRGGTLPVWYDERKVTATIGAHTFLRLA